MQESDYSIKIQELEKIISDLNKENRELLKRNLELIEQNRNLGEGLEKINSKINLESADKKSIRYKMVTVFFADIKGFSKLAEKQNAELLIDELDSFYLMLDEIIASHNIEKISSIGDTLMCAGGIPKKNRTNPIEMVLAAIKINDKLKEFQKELFGENQIIWEISMGIHTGPVIAAEQGKKKITYELKGETVNIASRIESASEPGKIIISEMTRELISEYFRCSYIGKIPVKYVGDINLYQVKGFTPKYSVDKKGLVPNKKFQVKFQLIKYDDLEEFMLDKLERELPKYLHYHNLKHTIDVGIQAEILGQGEGISDEEMLLLKTAALFHDSGQTIQTRDHELIGTRIAASILPKFGYTNEQIVEIQQIIMATKLPPQPKTLLQKIICDADLDYLGRSDFIPVSNTLYKELHEQNLIGSINDWNKLQIKFLTPHQYFTETANKLREVNKQTQIERLKKEITD
ncbi:MAG: HD domain-containing protein [Bacteroidia bacterium]|nr:HD domain-containing protein [Bacteroidia bacterium]